MIYYCFRNKFFLTFKMIIFLLRIKMAHFKKGPPGKRGIGFGGFNLKSNEEPETLSTNPEFAKDRETKRPKSQPEPSRKLPKLTEEE